jgi:hypothetical protein
VSTCAFGKGLRRAKRSTFVDESSATSGIMES